MWIAINYPLMDKSFGQITILDATVPLFWQTYYFAGFNPRSCLIRHGQCLESQHFFFFVKLHNIAFLFLVDAQHIPLLR